MGTISTSCEVDDYEKQPWMHTLQISNSTPRTSCHGPFHFMNSERFHCRHIRFDAKLTKTLCTATVQTRPEPPLFGIVEPYNVTSIDIFS
jgi:hypothetical protein